MFTRGGVYRVVKEALGGTLAKLSVSALMFDYILTGPISGVSAGQYIVGLLAQTVTYFGHPWHPTPDTINQIAAGIALCITIYFWWRNTKGLHESSDDALRIMYVTTVMVVVLILWCVATILLKPETQRLPPLPIPAHLAFTRDAVGWLPHLLPGALHPVPVHPGDDPRWGLLKHPGMLLGLIGIFIAFGHSFLAMSGEESLAQVNRELEHPKHKNLMRAGLVIFAYSLVFTSTVSFFAYAIIPDAERPKFFDNLISGIAVHLVGPTPIKLLFQAFIVIVGFLMLAGAINTSIIGANGVLNRVGEDGVMPDWFRVPHKRYGTTFRLINLITAFQLVAIIGSRGDTYTLGEAYAFGVVWSFAFKGLAMLVLRYKDKTPRLWKVPLNIPIGMETELPLGLGIIAVLLFCVAGINLITKQVATVSGIAFTLVFFCLFFFSEQAMHRRRKGSHVEVDQFNLSPQETVSNETVDVRQGNTLCLVRDYNTLGHLNIALEITDTALTDLVVMTTQVMRGPDAGYENISEKRLFTSREQLLFSRVVSVAEKAGKHVDLLVVPSTNVDDAVALTAAQLNSAIVIAGRSSVYTPEEQAQRIGQAWERVQGHPNHPVRFLVVDSDSTEIREFSLGAHAPSLSETEVEQIHQIWLNVMQERGNNAIHHRDIVTVALARLDHELQSAQRIEIIEALRALNGPGEEDID